MQCHIRTLWNLQQPNGGRISFTARLKTNSPTPYGICTCQQVPVPVTFESQTYKRTQSLSSPQLASDRWVCQWTTSPKSQMHTRSSKNLESIAKHDITLSITSGFTPLSKRSSTIGSEAESAAKWRGVFPNCKNADHSVFLLCNKISAMSHLLNT